MTFNQIVALAKDTTFQGQIQAAALSQAHNVLNETNSGGMTGQEAARIALAKSALADGCVTLLQRFVWGVASVPGFSAVANDASSTNDAAIASVLVSKWDDLALISNPEKS